jgi:hypothetical protein
MMRQSGLTVSLAIVTLISIDVAAIAMGGGGGGAGAGGTYAVPAPGPSTPAPATGATSPPNTASAALQRCRDEAHGDGAAVETCMAKKGYKKPP